MVVGVAASGVDVVVSAGALRSCDFGFCVAVVIDAEGLSVGGLAAWIDGFAAGVSGVAGTLGVDGLDRAKGAAAVTVGVAGAAGAVTVGAETLGVAGAAGAVTVGAETLGVAGAAGAVTVGAATVGVAGAAGAVTVGAETLGVAGAAGAAGVVACGVSTGRVETCGAAGAGVDVCVAVAAAVDATVVAVVCVEGADGRLCSSARATPANASASTTATSVKTTRRCADRNDEGWDGGTELPHVDPPEWYLPLHVSKRTIPAALKTLVFCEYPACQATRLEDLRGLAGGFVVPAVAPVSARPPLCSDRRNDWFRGGAW